MISAGYVRVSTEQQDFEHQKRAIRKQAATRGDEIVYWFEEKTGGKKLARPELTKLRDQIRAGQHRKLYVFALDRLSRGGIADTFRVVEEVRRNGCAIVSVSDPFDLDGPASDVVLAVLAWSAQFELRRLGDRIRAAKGRIEAAGGRWGRPRALDPGTIARARELKAGGKSLRQIAVALKVKRATLQRALARKGHYAGQLNGGESDPLTRGVP